MLKEYCDIIGKLTVATILIGELVDSNYPLSIESVPKIFYIPEGIS